ncbi:MAG: DUF2034 domain-containing protein [Acidobacteriia bacterium]|nr:DUF2034 domain-containing protein [Terriglobia bacterium]
MNFKNDLERKTFEAAKNVCGDATIEHNKTLRIELATSPEVASFVGPPKKEIDVITTGFQQSPDLKLLISCKDYETSKAEPADIQEWAAVVHTMNKYSEGKKYLGLIMSPSGFTKGCEPWGSSYNLGLIPPLKGKKLKFGNATCSQMVERVLKAVGKRLYFPHNGILIAPGFYDFVYRLTESFEGRDELVKQFGHRYKLLGKGWDSSFPEVFKTFEGKAVREIETTSVGVFIIFSDNLTFRMIGRQIEFGPNDGWAEGTAVMLPCEKNLQGETCSFDFIKKLVLGQKVTSAGDWGDRFEFGLTEDLMLAVQPNKLQIYRTRNPPKENLL